MSALTSDAPPGHAAAALALVATAVVGPSSSLQVPESNVTPALV
jgi:hypothetical protein